MSIGTERERRITWWHRLPRSGPVERIAALVEAARDRRVVHAGFVDELMASKQAQGIWLHAELARVAKSLVGLDIDPAGVAAARAQGYEAHVVDCQSRGDVLALKLAPADIVIAGELLEHLDAPGPFLRAMKELAGEIVLTTPNAYRVANFFVPITGREAVHPDHTAWHSPQTLRRLLAMTGWEVSRITYYHNTVLRPLQGGRKSRIKTLLANTARLGLRGANGLLPYWSDGMIVWARRAKGPVVSGTPGAHPQVATAR
jgi:hypothetical protein